MMNFVIKMIYLIRITNVATIVTWLYYRPQASVKFLIIVIMFSVKLLISHRSHPC